MDSENIELTETVKVFVKTFGPIAKDSEEYKELRKKLNGRRRFRVWDLDGKSKVRPGFYNIEKRHLFDNQSNTVEGARIFDFADYSSHPDSERMRYGHYIEQGFDDLEAARAARVKCGYCGHQSEDMNAGDWCIACRGSEYLTPDSYHLTQMRPITAKNWTSDPMPSDVKDDIAAKQKATQTRKAQKKFDDKIAKLEQDQINAQHEIEFLNVLIEIGLGHYMENVIFYNHVNAFCFGWRDALNDDQKAEIENTFKDAEQWHMFNIKFK